MNRTGLLSIIVPVYRVEVYLDRCIESLVNQTYHNLEILLVDDGSPDLCSEMCDYWESKDSRIQVIHKPNGGLSDARNIGMLAGEGEYISFVDSDDWIDLETYSIVLQRMKETQAQIGAFNIINVETEDFVPDLSDEFEVMDSEKAIDNTIDDIGVKTVAWNKVYHKSILDSLFFPKGKLHEDEFFTFHALDRADKIVFLQRQCYYYFQRSDSIMGQYSIRHIDMIEGVKSRMDFVKEHYPRLYCKAKLSFSLCCFSQYKKLVSNQKADIDGRGKKKIKQLRKSVFITRFDVAGMNRKTVALHRLTNTNIGFNIIFRIINKKK